MQLQLAHQDKQRVPSFFFILHHSIFNVRNFHLFCKIFSCPPPSLNTIIMSSENPLQVIDVSKADQATADELLKAAMGQGFLMIEGHDFTQQEVDELFVLSKNYFEAPFEEKMKYKISENNHGYTAFGAENLDEEHPDKPKGDPKEGFNFACLNLAKGETEEKVPPLFLEEANAAKVKSAILKFKKSVDKILVLLAMGLKVDQANGGADYFLKRHAGNKESGSAFRFLHYPNPKSLNPEEVIRAGAHTDYGGVTLLFQREGEGGLEIHSPITKTWTPVPFVGASPKFKNAGSAPPLVVNIADQLSFWTNGILKSTIHRVKFPKEAQLSGKSRYSIVFFSHPNDDTLLEPVPSEIVKQVKGRGAGYDLEKFGKSLTAGEHLLKRLAATYTY
ncbi:unnamed protein product [Kuraishia capsulata CBS 1993]|uniref:Fe2OG dioxygenase domain-containing protein n=1 Tax=Kuraishia capsulata CBS 1993 TaxID=1382522 RepID=W6MQ92_9ASCO|nr:uncharacterized protein KUCA_T00003410001 [Kuraishia capsulata CBS 1993]CDK27432.1 unnamed protein product [Kuraishia capsulata CBS 1993]